MSLTAYHGHLTGMAESIKAIEVDTEAKILLMLDEIGRTTVEYLRSITGEQAPPIYPGGSFRYAHPGHWADRSGLLAASYRYEVNRAAFRLAIINDDPGGYGVYLERRVGFWVLTGVTDPGGPVEQALLQAMAVIAPDWKWSRSPG